jgi:hypothetical protein
MGVTSDGQTFSRALARLKRRGCNLLVVGTTSASVRRTITDRLLGDTSSRDRRHLFVFTDGSHVRQHPHLASATGSRTRIVTRSTPMRAAATSEPPAEFGPGNSITRSVNSDLLGPLAWAIADEIHAFADEADGLEPSELRLCFDSLSPLLASHSERGVDRFLEAVTARVRSVSGMGHYHLPVAVDDDAVERLAPLFDAVIELRLRETLPEQRWHLSPRVDPPMDGEDSSSCVCERRSTTPWIPL